MFGDLKFYDEIFGVVGNEFIMDEDIPSDCMSVYVVIRCILYDKVRCCGMLNLRSVCNLLNIDIGKNTKFINQIRDSIVWLIDNEYIELHDDFYNVVEFDGKYNGMYRVRFLMENEGVFNCEGGFTKIPEKNLMTILSYIKSCKGTRKYQLVRYYLCIARICSNECHFGHMSIKNLSEIIGVSEVTCCDWNMVLKQLGIIEYNNEYGHVVKDKFKMDCTMFGHYNLVGRDGYILTKDNFDYYVDNKAKTSKIVKVNKSSIASKKSIAMKKVWEERKANSE